MTIRVGINGFGRIGRQVHRAIREHYPDRIDVVAVNDAGNRKIMTHILMCCGSVHLPEEVDRLDMRIRYRGIRSIYGSRAIRSRCAAMNTRLHRSGSP
jgi:glyceraldehyde-3-phosphate dehydrogenase/erythrose-4-phosphate dehydrogenase